MAEALDAALAMNVRDGSRTTLRRCLILASQLGRRPLLSVADAGSEAEPDFEPFMGSDFPLAAVGGSRSTD